MGIVCLPNIFLVSFSALFAYYEKSWCKHSYIGIFEDNVQQRGYFGHFLNIYLRVALLGLSSEFTQKITHTPQSEECRESDYLPNICSQHSEVTTLYCLMALFQQLGLEHFKWLLSYRELEKKNSDSFLVRWIQVLCVWIDWIVWEPLQRIA